MEMSFDLKCELAKKEYVNAINEINTKYNLPLTVVEIILNGICNEVYRMKQVKIQEEQSKLDNKEESDK